MLSISDTERKGKKHVLYIFGQPLFFSLPCHVLSTESPYFINFPCYPFRRPSGQSDDAMVDVFRNHQLQGISDGLLTCGSLSQWFMAFDFMLVIETVLLHFYRVVYSMMSRPYRILLLKEKSRNNLNIKKMYLRDKEKMHLTFFFIKVL